MRRRHVLRQKGRGRKRKKRRKKRLPRSPRLLLCGRARRRQRQWHFCSAEFPGDVPLRAVFPLVILRPEMLGIMAGMDLKDSGALFVDSGSDMCKARLAGLLPRYVFLWLSAGPLCSCSCRYDSEGELPRGVPQNCVFSSLVRQWIQIYVCLQRPGFWFRTAVNCGNSVVAAHRWSSIFLSWCRCGFPWSYYIWQSCVRCSVFACGVPDFGLSGFRTQHSLV